MANYADKYLNLNGAYGSTLKDMRINATKGTFDDTFKDSPSYYQVTLNNSSATPVDVQIVDDSELGEQKVVIVQSNVNYNFGDYIKWNNSYWLTLIIDDMAGIYKRGVIKRCFSSLKWLDKNVVKEAYFVYKSDTIRGAGVVDGTVIIMPNERRYLLIQNNADTQKIEKIQRFIVDGRAWRTVSIDRLETGLIFIELEESQINTANDNVDLRVADYYNNIHTYILSILNGSSSKVNKGATLQLNVEAKDNGTVVTMPVTYSSSNSSVATVDSNGLVTGISDGNATITATLNQDNTVSASIAIAVATIVQDHFTTGITSTNTTPSIIKSSMSVTYDGTVYNNGVQVTDGSKTTVFELFADDQVSSTNLATFTANTGSSCTIKANSNSQYGYVQLKCSLASDSTIFSWLRIQIKSLI